MPGPLEGVRIVEFASIGPVPFCGMMLADHGAEVVRIERPGGSGVGIAIDPARDPLQRSRRTITLDLKHPEATELVRDLCRTADGLIEGFRPGVMERLGLGPDRLLAENERLVFGRMTGWGQDGPCAAAPGHDIDYIALAGALSAFGRAGDKPTAPINVIGDFGGGGLLLAFAMVSAILSARASGRGQVIDCAMVDGAAVLMSQIWGLQAQGLWSDTRGTNLLDGGAPFYDTYQCADGRFVAVGAIEPAFYAALRRLTGLADDPDLDAQLDPAGWPLTRQKLAAAFRTRSRDAWCAAPEAAEACVAPVLTMAEAPLHAHNVARGTFATIGGAVQPMPAPRFSATPSAQPRPAGSDGAETESLLKSLGYDRDRIARLRQGGALG